MTQIQSPASGSLRVQIAYVSNIATNLITMHEVMRKILQTSHEYYNESVGEGMSRCMSGGGGGGGGGGKEDR